MKSFCVTPVALKEREGGIRRHTEDEQAAWPWRQRLE